MNIVRTSVLLALMTTLFVAVGYMIGGAGGMMIAFIIAAAVNLFSYWNSDKLVLRLYKAKELDTHATLHRRVVHLAARAGLPPPRVYLIDNPQPNAFATGRNPQNAAVAATTGLLAQLNEQEISGVIAHELAHIQHRDTLTMTITATLACAIASLSKFAFLFGRGRNQHPFGAIGLVGAMIVAPLAAMLVQMAVSRTREYAADRRGAEICGNPLWLAAALQKIAQSAHRNVNPAAQENPATAHMFIINPLSGRSADHLFATHPATQNRIAALHHLAKEMGIYHIDSAPNRHAGSILPSKVISKKTGARPRWMRLGQQNKQRNPTKKRGPWD